MTLVAEILQPAAEASDSMRATVFHGPGDIIGHEPVGVIAELGAGVTGYEIGQIYSTRSLSRT